MLPQFTSTAASLSRATTLISRVGTDADLYDDPETENLALLLDSKYEAEKSEGLKRLIALMSQGRDVSNFFPQVVKNVATHSLELKKLVYIYLVHYAEKRPDEALLAMNTFQKDLSDLNPLVRAWALRAMSGIRVRVVLPLVVLAVNKCARDPSPYVRRCAAHAISKVYSLDHEQHQDALEELICLLINDNSPGVIGAVAAAFTSVCPEKLSFWEARYQKLCELLLSVDEWGQVILIDILLRYAVGRHGYPKGSVGHSSIQDEALTEHNLRERKLKGRMEEGLLVAGSKKQMETDGVGSSRSAASRELDFRISAESWLANTDTDGNTEVLQEDTALLLQCTLPLLQSHNSAVVMAAVGVHWLLASVDNLKKIVKPVIFLLRSSIESQYVVLANIATFVRKAPKSVSLFEEHYEEFFISSVDGEQIRTMKLDILCQIATESSIRPILREFQEYVRDPDRQFAANTVRAIGRCAFRLPSVSKVCTEALLVLASGGSSSHPQSTATEAGLENEGDERSKERVAAERAQKQLTDDKKMNREALVVMEAIMALRAIIHEHPVENEEVLVRLARSLDLLKVPEARTIIIWMVGEFGTVGTRLPKMVPVILQYLGGTFKKESDEAKLQILTCAAKVVLRLGMTSESSSSSKTSLLILNYVLRLAALDLTYDIRDRARLYQHLLAFYLQDAALSEKKGQGKGIADKFLDLDLLESDGKETVGARRGDSGQRSPNSFLHDLDNEKGDFDNNKMLLLKVAKKIFLMPKSAPILPPLAPDRSAFVPGTMSHIVLHRAPNYHPLPRPFSVGAAPPPPPPVSDQRLPGADGDLEYSSNGEYTGTESEDRLSDASSSQGSSHSFYEEDSASPHSSEGDAQNRASKDKISGRNKTKRNASSSSRRSSQWSIEEKRRQQQQALGPLINLSDSSEAGERRGIGQDNDESQQPVDGISSSADFGLISAAELDSWLGSSEPRREDMPPASETPSGYATVAVGRIDVKPRIHSLLDFTNGAGLDVKYSFDRPASASREGLLIMKLYFENRSLDTLSDINVMDAESGSSSPQSVSGANNVEEIESEEQGVLELEGGDMSERKLCLHFGDHGKWIRLTILCGGKRYPVKIMPDIGAVIRPTMLTPDEFALAESKLSGMYEALRRCSLIVPSRVGSVSIGGEEDQVLLVARAIAEKVLNTAHVFFVSTIMPIGDSQLGVHSAIQGDGLQGLSLQFSGKTLTGSALCLIRVTVLTEPLRGRDGGAHLDVIVKANCEDTVYGLNLLQEISKAFNSSD